MLIKNITLQKKGDEIILSTKIIFDNGKNSKLFFSLDSRYAAFIHNDASPFLSSLLLPAMKLGEDIHIDGTISTRLLENTQKIMHLVTDWNIGLKKIKITAKHTAEDYGEPNNIGAFFSGGVDSFTTYLRNKSESKEMINYFVFVHGFDIFLKDEATFDKIYKTLTRVAEEEKIALIAVKTNLREIIDPILDWGYSHGGAMGSIALLLRNGFKTMYISGTYSAGHLFPWGSHPELDPLWSTEKMQIVHDSSDISRLEKIRLYISQSPVALKYLRVCWSSSEYNCAKCSKCIRTMLSLYITNALHNSKTFPNKLDADLIRNFFLTSKSQVVFFEELLSELKKENRDHEIQDAITHMIKKSKKPDIKRTIRSVISVLDKKYNHDRLFWYLAKKGVTRP